MEKAPAICGAPEVLLIPDTDDNVNEFDLKQRKRKKMEKGV